MPILGASVSRDFNAPTDLRQFQRLMFLEAGGGAEAHFSVLGLENGQHCIHN